MRIDEIDKNFSVDNNTDRENITFLNVKEKPFDIYGAYDYFNRLPKEVAENINEGVAVFSKCTAGVRVRFSTDSPYIAIAAKIPSDCEHVRIPLTCTSGFDMYEYKNGDYKYLKTFEPAATGCERVSGVYDFHSGGMHDVIINFPVFNGVDELYIGIKDKSKLLHGSEYKIKKPVVYYGSSITHGACASRPGTIYESILSRRFDSDFLNLGFSGSALGEETAAEYISKLDMSVFVLDYDHNAPNAEHLKNTHERFFKTVRAKNPNLPIVILSMPFTECVYDSEERRKIIKATYENAVKNGDKNVWFIDTSEAVKELGGENGTVDGCHPNDLGFWCIAEKIGEVCSEILKA